MIAVTLKLLQDLAIARMVHTKRNTKERKICHIYILPTCHLFISLTTVKQYSLIYHSAKATHQLAEASNARNEALKKAFGISEYFKEGSSLDPDRKAKEKAAMELAQKKYE